MEELTYYYLSKPLPDEVQVPISPMRTAPYDRLHTLHVLLISSTRSSNTTSSA